VTQQWQADPSTGNAALVRVTEITVHPISLSGLCQVFLRTGCYPVAIRLLSLPATDTRGRAIRIRIWLRTRDSNPEPCG